MKAEQVPVGATPGQRERKQRSATPRFHHATHTRASRNRRPLRGGGPSSSSYVTHGHHFVWVFGRLLERQIGFQRFSLKIAQSVWCPAMLGYFYAADVMHRECHGTKWADNIATSFNLKMISGHDGGRGERAREKCTFLLGVFRINVL